MEIAPRLSCAVRLLALLAVSYANPAATSIVSPSISSAEAGVVAAGGTFSVKCDVPDDWATQPGHYVQIFKTQISSPQYDGLSSISGDANEQLNKILSTNNEWHPHMLETANNDPTLDINNYAIQYDQGNNIVITVTNAREGDSGIFSCRTLLEDSNSTTVMNLTAYGTINITVIAPLDGSDVSLVEEGDDPSIYIPVVPVGETLVLDSSINKHFGCQVHHGLSLPEIRVFFRQDITEVDVPGLLYRSPRSDTTNYGITVAYSTESQATATMSSVPNLGDYDGWELVCRATLPLVDPVEVSMTVTAIGPTSAPVVDGDGDVGDGDVSDGGDGGGASHLQAAFSVGKLIALVIVTSLL